MHFERRNAFKNANNYIFLQKKNNPTLPKIFRPVTRNTLIFLFGLMESSILIKLEDLKVLKRSPDLLNNVKIGQGQLRLIIQTYFVIPYMGNGHFDQVTQK